MNTNVSRAVAIVFLAIATLAFAYNQMAQAHAVRYRAFSTDNEAIIDTWRGKVCRIRGKCFKIVEDPTYHPDAVNPYRAPAQMDTGLKMDTTR